MFWSKELSFLTVLVSAPVSALVSLGLANSAYALSPALDINTIDTVLRESENQYSDLVTGTEKHIRWYRGKQQTDWSIVYIHGFSASAKEISPVTERLADLLQANVYYARLRGHGRSGDAMAEASVDAWQKDTLEAWQIGQLIGQRVVVISASTGGTLATWLAAQPQAQSMAANIMVSPNFGIASRSGEIVRWRWGLQLAKWVSGPYREFTPQNSLHERYWTERYPIEALVPMIHMVDLVVDQDHSITQVPHFAVYSPRDQVIRVDRIKQLTAEMTNASVTLLEFNESTDPYQHVLAGDACSPETTDTMVGLLHDYVTALSPP